MLDVITSLVYNQCFIVIGNYFYIVHLSNSVYYVQNNIISTIEIRDVYKKKVMTIIHEYTTYTVDNAIIIIYRLI